MKKIYAVLGSCLFVFSGAVVAQDISLPDVTTVITGDTVLADDEALPDFNDVLVVPQGSGSTVPQLPDVDMLESSEVKPAAAAPAEKAVYAEGLVGGGYPTLFIGDFSIFRQAGNSPFKLSFSHDSANGYSGASLTDSYSDRATSISLDKSFDKETFSWGFGGSYDTESDGLQNKVDGISSLNQNLLAGYGNIDFTLPKGFLVGAKLNADFYNRYSDISEAVYDSVEKWARKNTLLGLNPSVYAKWAGYGFTAGLSADYKLSADILDAIDGTAMNRGQFKADVAWKNDVLRVYGDVALVVGNLLNNHPVIAPFTLGVEYAFPVYFSNRRFAISAEGGLYSSESYISDLERKYSFSALSFFPSETSDWYGKLGISVPLKESFTGNVGIEYRGTALGNGVWEPVYDDLSLTSGIYGYACTERQLLTTDFALAYHYKIFSIQAGWHSNWIYVPVLETPQALSLTVSFQGEDSAWGAEVSAKQYISESVELPVINLECFARLTSAVRVVGSVEDIVKLLKGEQRVYAGQYAGRGGAAKIMLKFFF